MNVVASRVDERLVHGQIMTSWSKYLQLSRIIVVDDQVAADGFMCTVLTMSAPAGLTIDILGVDDACKSIVSDGGDQNTMLLFKRISCALALAKALKGTPHEIRELNLGNLGSVPDRVQVTKNVWLSDAEKDEIRELKAGGVDVFLQMIHTDPRVDAATVL